MNSGSLLNNPDLTFNNSDCKPLNNIVAFQSYENNEPQQKSSNSLADESQEELNGLVKAMKAKKTCNILDSNLDSNTNITPFNGLSDQREEHKDLSIEGEKLKHYLSQLSEIFKDVLNLKAKSPEQPNVSVSSGVSEVQSNLISQSYDQDRSFHIQDKFLDLDAQSDSKNNYNNCNSFRLNSFEAQDNSKVFPNRLLEESMRSISPNKNCTDYENYINDAFSLLRQHKPCDAIEWLADKIGKMGSNFQILIIPQLLLCLAYFWQNQLKKAFLKLKDAISINQNIIDEPVVIALALAIKKESSENIDYFLKPVRVESGFGRYVWAEILYKYKEYDEAFELALTILNFNPYKQYGYFLLASIIRKKKDIRHMLIKFVKRLKELLKFQLSDIREGLLKALVLYTYLRSITSQIKNNNIEVLAVITLAFFSKGYFDDPEDLIDKIAQHQSDKLGNIASKIKEFGKTAENLKTRLCDKFGYIPKKKSHTISCEDLEIDMLIGKFTDLSGFTGEAPNFPDSNTSSDANRDHKAFLQAHCLQGDLISANLELGDAFSKKDDKKKIYQGLISVVNTVNLPTALANIGNIHGLSAEYIQGFMKIYDEIQVDSLQCKNFLRCGRTLLFDMNFSSEVKSYNQIGEKITSVGE